MKNQIFIIGGGNTFKDKNQAIQYFENFDIDLEWKTKSWKDWLSWSLEDYFEFIQFKRPAKDNADYEIWKIVFEKYLQKINNLEQIFITHSLGTIFILKYLTENNFPKKIKQLHLISPIVSNDFQKEDDNENTGSFTFDISKISNIKNSCEEIHIWHSLDDEVCLYKNAEFIKKEIPESFLHTFSDKGHFSQSTFFELFDLLRKV